jgi:carbon storage regulator
MLVLSRKLNESIIVGDNITITVLEIRGDKVRIGVAAPRDVSVHRKEIWLTIQESKKSTVQ